MTKVSKGGHEDVWLHIAEHFNLDIRKSDKAAIFS